MKKKSKYHSDIAKTRWKKVPAKKRKEMMSKIAKLGAAKRWGSLNQPSVEEEDISVENPKGKEDKDL